MFGALALIATTLGVALLYVLRIGVLDRFSWPQHLLCLIAIVLAIVQLRRPSGRAAKVAAWAAIVGSLGFSGALEIATRYSDDRPRGPEVGTNLSALELVDAITDRPLRLADASHPGPTLLLCFRGFW